MKVWFDHIVKDDIYTNTHTHISSSSLALHPGWALISSYVYDRFKPKLNLCNNLSVLSVCGSCAR